MKRYITTNVNSAAAFDALVSTGAGVAIDEFPWDVSYCPPARACLAPDYANNGLWVALTADEPCSHIRVENHWQNGKIWEDSCLEFFFSPLGDSEYMNIEVNANGYMLIGVHTAAADDRRENELQPDAFDMRVTREFLSGGIMRWSLRYFISFDYIRRFFPAFDARPGQIIRGNFQSCGDEAVKHWGMWNPIGADKLSFHRPECFGEIVL